MKKILISTVAVSLLSSVAFAGISKFEVTPMVGKKIYNYSDDAPRFDDGQAVVGIRANAYVKENVSIQLGAEASNANKMGDGGKTDITRGMASLQYDVPSRGKVTPYVFAGMGYEKLERSYTAGNVDSQAFYNTGAGLRYNVNPRVDLVAETRVIHKVEDQDTDLIGNVGLGFKFGGMSRPVVPAVVKPAPVYKTEPSKPVMSLHDFKEKIPVIVEPVAVSNEVVSTRYEYDSGSVTLCNDGSTVASSYAGEVASDISGYYVQVIALRKNSPDVITSRLDARGYNYTLKQEGSLTRVLVGPYESRTAASRALSGLKKVRRDAFIYHAK